MARAPAPECQRNNLVAPRCCTSGLHFDKDAINAAIGQTREAIATEYLAKIKSATESLEQASHAMSKAMHESATKAQTAVTRLHLHIRTHGTARTKQSSLTSPG